MNNMKLFNDPIYGFIQFPYPILYEIIDHPYVQRLRRISQMGLSHYVYPGAVHTRFHHTIGALHLMTEAIRILRSKGVEISDDEAIAASIAILMHDIGHGPFSHALEGEIIHVSHEFLSIQFMEDLKSSFGKHIELALDIFQNKHQKLFLHQLVSSQLDMDRMDYLSRDSFFTGVVEGVIGYDRIIKMLNVRNNELVVEEKGIHSVEMFLMARRMMYWQVYLHKTSVSVENMLQKVIRRLKQLLKSDDSDYYSSLLSPSLSFFLCNAITADTLRSQKTDIIEKFSKLDETDIYYSLKNLSECTDEVLRFYSSSILNRRIFKVEHQDEPITIEQIEAIKSKLLKTKTVTMNIIDDVILLSEESNISYNTKKETIKILTKKNEVIPITQFSFNLIDTRLINKFFLCYPKIY